MSLILRPPGARAPLPEQVAALGRTRKRVTLAAGLFALAAVAVGGALVTGVLDAWLHLPPLARGFALVLTLAAAGAIWFGRVDPALRLPTAPLPVALELEDRFPRLNDSLASAVAFLETGESELAGISNRLRGAAVLKAEKLAERCDLGRVVPVARCWRAFWACAAVTTVAVPLALVAPDRAAIALTRFADPFGTHPWPAKTRIDVLTPDPLPARVSEGDPFELRFVVRGLVPDRAVVTVRLADGHEFEEAYPLSEGGDPREPAAAHVAARFEPDRLPQSFTFRIRANDADTGWLAVAVAPPPKLAPLGGRRSPLVRAAPPAYTGLPAFDLPDGAPVIEIPLGTALTLRAAADMRLSAAVLTYLGDRSGNEQAAGLAPIGLLNPFASVGAQLLADALGADVPVTISGDGQTLFAAFSPSMPGKYALRLTDETGLTGTHRLEIRLPPDPTPAVSLLRPAPGRDPPLYTPEAAVPVQVIATDTVYGLRRVFVEYRVGRDGVVRSLPLAEARRIDPAALVAVLGGGAAAADREMTRLEVERAVPVAALLRDDGTPVREGDEVTLWAAADDHDDVSVLKPPGRSTPPVKFEVASRQAVEAALQKGLASLRADLIRAREQQREAAQQVAEATRPDAPAAPEPQKLLAAEHAQRQLRARVIDPRDGLRTRAEVLRATARANNLPRSEVTDRVETAADEIGRLADRDLAAVEPLLGEARQQSAEPPSPDQDKAVAGLLTRAARHQRSAEEGLSDLIDLLSDWGGANEVRAEARMLRDAVAREAEGVVRMRDRVPPGKGRADLDGNPGQELDRAGGRLYQLKNQADQLVAKAPRVAAERDRQAAALRVAAAWRSFTAGIARTEAQAHPPGTPAARQAGEAAETLTAEAEELRRAADRALTEAAALRAAVAAAGGQALPEDLREATEAIPAKGTGDTGLDRLGSAVARLDRMIDELAEKSAEQPPELARKRLRGLADRLDALAGDQDDLRRRVAEAARDPDPIRREEALRRLAAEQQELLERAKHLAQTLSREKAEEAARDARQAADRMETARDDLEQRRSPTQAQEDAVGRLDNARDRLDAAADRRPEKDPPARTLTDEKRRRLLDQVRALLDRQKAAAAEANRIQERVLADKGWERPVLTSYVDLADRERVLATEARTLADREFAPLPVFTSMLQEAARSMDRTARRAEDRVRDARDADPGTAFDPELEAANDARVRRPLDLATRRLEQLLAALHPDEPKAKEGGGKGGKKPGGGAGQPPAGSQGQGDMIPPLAQLKALRALQAELNERTAAFAREHQDPERFTDDEREELKELEDAQRQITALFEQLAKEFQGRLPPEKP